MNITRLGHYFTPNSAPDAETVTGGCQAALVVFSATDEAVNLIVWDSDGDDDTRENVPVMAPAGGSASFHLSRDCPWTR